MMERLRFFAELRNYAANVELFVSAQGADGKAMSVAEPLVFHQKDEASLIERPAITMSMRDAQSLIDELWRVGFRPTQGKQSEGQFAAQGRHLEDMRRIAFGKLKLNEPTQ